LIKSGVNVKLVVLKDEADDPLFNTFRQADKFVVNVENLCKLIKILKLIKAKTIFG
jgi:hypothetical protein